MSSKQQEKTNTAKKHQNKKLQQLSLQQLKDVAGGPDVITGAEM